MYKHLQLNKKKVDNSIEEEEKDLDRNFLKEASDQEIYEKFFNFIREMKIKTARKYYYSPTG